MIGTSGPFGPQCDFSRGFTQDYFQLSNQLWLTEYHVDGFRYDEVTDYYFSPTDTAYSKLAYDTYRFSQSIPRFLHPGSYSRIIQTAEALSLAKTVLTNTYSNAAWQDDLLNKSEGMIQGDGADEDFAHLLDANWSGYPQTKTVEDENGHPVDMPVAPFQYIESHDHSQLIVFTGTDSPDPLATGGNRDNYYRLQPFAIALLTAQGIPMLWQGQEFADNVRPLPGSGSARIRTTPRHALGIFLRRPGFAADSTISQTGSAAPRLALALRSRDSFFYNQQSLHGNAVVAYHRHAPADAIDPEEYAMVLLNFGGAAATVDIPFPKAGTYREMIDDDLRPTHFDLSFGSDGAHRRPSPYRHTTALCSSGVCESELTGLRRKSRTPELPAVERWRSTSVSAVKRSYESSSPISHSSWKTRTRNHLGRAMPAISIVSYWRTLVL